MIIAGIGCRTEVTVEAVVALVEQATSILVMRGFMPRIDPSGRPDGVAAPRGEGPRDRPEGDGEKGASDRVVSALAVPEFRRDEPGIAAAAAALNLPILWVGRDALKGEQGRCVTRSARAEAEVGLSCVAEAAALYAAGKGSRLILPRIAGGGVTCALAEGPGPRALAEGVHE